MYNYLEFLDELTTHPEEYMPHSKAVVGKRDINKWAKEMGFQKWKNIMILVIYFNDGIISAEYIKNIFTNIETFDANELRIAYSVGHKYLK